MVGKTLIQLLAERNKRENVNTRIIAPGRDVNKFKERFADTDLTSNVSSVEHDVLNPLKLGEHVDFIIHMV